MPVGQAIDALFEALGVAGGVRYPEGFTLREIQCHQVEAVVAAHGQLGPQALHRVLAAQPQRHDLAS